MANIDADLIDALHEELADAVGDREITPESIIQIATIAMAMVARQKDMSGADKKALVITLLKYLVKHSNMKRKDRQAVRMVIDTTLPITIDLLIGAGNGEFDFKKMKSRFAWIADTCCCCCKK